MTQIFDLFGDPVPHNHGRRGRPQHIPTNENRRKVSMMLARGWSNERIAAVLRCTLPTLRKHYFSELKFRDVARDRIEAALAMRVWDQVEAGNVGAMRLFDRLMEKNDIAVGHASFYHGQRAPTAAPAEEKPERLGKKELANQAAQTAGEGSEWGDDLKPPMN